MGFDTIWRVNVPLAATSVVELPALAQVLSVKVRSLTHGPRTAAPGQPSFGVDLWARVNPETPKGPMPVCLVGTGWAGAAPSADYRFIDTILIHDDTEAYHVFVGDSYEQGGSQLRKTTLHGSHAENEALVAGSSVEHDPDFVRRFPVRRIFESSGG